MKARTGNPSAAALGAGRGPRLHRATVTLAVVSSLSVAFYVATVARRIGYPYELQFFEGSTVEVSARVTAGLPLYGPPTTDFTPWPYPPLYFVVTGELAKLTGLSLPTLRVVSFAASLVSLVLLLLIVRRASGSTVAGIVSAGLFAGTYRVTDAWFDAARVDSLFLALVLAAVYAGLSARTWRGGVGLGLLLGLAFLTKQNALVVAAPMLVYLCWRRRPVGAAATAVLASITVGSLVIGDLLTDGWYSPYVLWQLLGHGTVLSWLAAFWVVDLVLPFGLILLALAWWSWSRQQRPRRPVPEPTAYLLASSVGLVIASLAGRLHDGGYVNVAIPAHAAMALLLGLVTATVVHHHSTTAATVLGATAVITAQLFVMAAWHPQVVPTEKDRIEGDRFVAAVRTLPGEVLIPSHPYYLRLADLPTHASAIAIGDLMATRPGRARDAMDAQLPWPLDGVDAVLLDAPSDANIFGTALQRDFTLVTDSFIAPGAFRPVTDVATAPSWLYIRTSELSP